MLILSKELLVGKPRYTLTVVTTPSDAVCKITANGQTLTAKSLTAEKGTYISVTVSYSNTTSKTYTLTLNKNTTLTFTRTYTTSSSTSLNTNYSRHGTGSENITVSSGGVASGFTSYGSLILDGTTTGRDCTSFKWYIKVKTPDSSFSNNAFVIGNDYFYNSGGSAVWHSCTSLIYKTNRTLVLSRGSSNLIESSTVLSSSTIYYFYVAWNGSTYSLAWSTSGFSTTSNLLTKSSTNNPFYVSSNQDYKDICVGNMIRGNSAGVGSANRPFTGSIYLMDTQVYYNGSKVWDGTVTTTSYNYYFNVSVS